MSIQKWKKSRYLSVMAQAALTLTIMGTSVVMGMENTEEEAIENQKRREKEENNIREESQVLGELLRGLNQQYGDDPACINLLQQYITLSNIFDKPGLTLSEKREAVKSIGRQADDFIKGRQNLNGVMNFQQAQDLKNQQRPDNQQNPKKSLAEQLKEQGKKLKPVDMSAQKVVAPEKTLAQMLQEQGEKLKKVTPEDRRLEEEKRLAAIAEQQRLVQHVPDNRQIVQEPEDQDAKRLEEEAEEHKKNRIREILDKDAKGGNLTRRDIYIVISGFKRELDKEETDSAKWLDNIKKEVDSFPKDPKNRGKVDDFIKLEKEKVLERLQKAEDLRKDFLKGKRSFLKDSQSTTDSIVKFWNDAISELEKFRKSKMDKNEILENQVKVAFKRGNKKNDRHSRVNDDDELSSSESSSSDSD